MQSTNVTHQPKPRQLMPDGHSDLVFNFAEPLERFHVIGADCTRLTSAFFTGTVTAPLFSQATGRVDLLGINFKPGGLRALFGIPLHLLSDRSVDLDLVVGPIAKEWSERLAEMKSFQAKIQFLDLMLRQRLKPIDSTVKAVVQFIERSNELSSISVIEKELGISGRNLERKFRDWVGASPKLYSRIIRFQRALKLFESSDGRDLSLIALDLGFYDQAHLTKDFKDFTGKPPLSFIRTSFSQELSDSYNTEIFSQSKTRVRDISFMTKGDFK